MKKFFLIFFCILSVLLRSTDAQSAYTLQKGTIISATVENPVDSGSSNANDTFTAKVSKPVLVNQIEILPVGSLLEGRVLKAKPASFNGQNGELEVKFEYLILPDGKRRQIDADLINFPLPKSEKHLGLFAFIFGSLGALIGTISAEEKGALIGAVSGSAIGVGVAALQKGKEISIGANQQIEIRLNQDVILPATDF
jgi:hypothetical protein